MPDHESIKHQFPLIGKNVKLCIFTREHVNNEYINWLNDYQVVKYSNQRFRQHSFDSCSEYLQSFKNTENVFLAIHLKDNNKFIGTMTVYYSVPHKVVNIGLLIGDKSFWGRGLGYEAWEMLMIFITLFEMLLVLEFLTRLELGVLI